MRVHSGHVISIPVNTMLSRRDYGYNGVTIYTVHINCSYFATWKWDYTIPKLPKSREVERKC